MKATIERKIWKIRESYVKRTKQEDKETEKTKQRKLTTKSIQWADNRRESHKKGPRENWREKTEEKLEV